jgi:predicted nucleic acid-binding protein
VQRLRNPDVLLSAQQKHALGFGEMSTILLGKELKANLALLDDFKARKLAKAEGLEIMGSVGLLETFYARGYLADLLTCFRQLLIHNVYIDQRLLNRRLRRRESRAGDRCSRPFLLMKSASEKPGGQAAGVPTDAAHRWRHSAPD